MALPVVQFVVVSVCLMMSVDNSEAGESIDNSQADLPISYFDYLAIVNGRFNDFDDKESGQDTTEAYLKPVSAPALQPEPVLYFEEILNGKLNRIWVLAKNDSSTDRFLYINYYNITDPSQYEPRTFNADVLANYKREDFIQNEDCSASYEKTAPGNLIGVINDPRNVVNGKSGSCSNQVNGLQGNKAAYVMAIGNIPQDPVYGADLSCDEIRGIVPISAEEKTSRLAYRLQYQGPRFPLIGAPADFVNPCQDGS